MTHAEFWAAEAEAEGKGRSGGELMADMFDDIEAEYAKASADLKNDPDTILKTMRSWYIPEDDSWSWDEGDEPEWVPEAIVEVEEAEVGGDFGGSGWMAVAKVRCSDSEVRRLKVTENTTHGSFYEPPDYDLNVEVL